MMIRAVLLNKSGNIVKEVILKELPKDQEIISLEDGNEGQVINIDGNYVKVQLHEAK